MVGKERVKLKAKQMLGGWGRAARGTRSGVSVWVILFSRGPWCPLFTEALGMAPRVDDQPIESQLN